MSQCGAPKGVILTVGLTHEPVIFSLRQIGPAYAAFICTPESAATLDTVEREYPLPPSHVRRREVRDSPDQIGRLVDEFCSAFLWLRDECDVSPSDICTDPTPGRKWMSAGVTMIASFLGLSMFYTEVKFVNGKPDQDTMRFIRLGNAYEQTGFIEAEKGRDLFNVYNFAAAADVFGRLRPMVSARADLYSGLERLCHTLHRWELFHHYSESLREAFADALKSLHRSAYSDGLSEEWKQFVEGVESLRDAIDAVSRSQKPAIEATIDLVMNAERRISQGRHDDAMARCYRALESLSQYLLADTYGLSDTKQPNYGKLTETQRDRLRSELGNLPGSVGLDSGWRILHALGHPAARCVLHEEKGKLVNRFAGLLDSRNNSILAHGWTPIGEERARRMVGRLRELLACVGGAEAQKLMSRLEVPKLPSLWGRGGGTAA